MNRLHIDHDALVRRLCRAVIRRVQFEHPDSSGYDLFLRLSAANPFGPLHHELQDVWEAEVVAALDPLGSGLCLRGYPSLQARSDEHMIQ